ncbi:MAG: TetR/AcrR family transcriptional regulator [Halanaerobiales bacterium]
MDRKTIQEQRKKGYFIEAAKKIIKEEGIKNLTVKKVADLAGFASGTLYNYFSDLNDLYIHCADDFWDECKDYLLAAEDNLNVKSKIISSSRAYCEYFIDNPNVFELIFLLDFEDVPVEPPEVALMLLEALREGVEAGLIPEERLKMIEDLIGNSIHGLLLFIIKKRTTATREEVLNLVEEEVKYLLEHC